jgi:hypothetical protein
MAMLWGNTPYSEYVKQILLTPFLIRLSALEEQTFFKITDLYYISLPLICKDEKWSYNVMGTQTTRVMILCPEVGRNLRLCLWLPLHLTSLLTQKA